MMARYEHLPIYGKAMEIAVYLQAVVRNFSRYDKYTVGTELRDHTRLILQLITRANSTAEKPPILTELVEQCELLKTSLIWGAMKNKQRLTC